MSGTLDTPKNLSSPTSLLDNQSVSMTGQAQQQISNSNSKVLFQPTLGAKGLTPAASAQHSGFFGGPQKSSFGLGGNGMLGQSVRATPSKR